MSKEPLSFYAPYLTEQRRLSIGDPLRTPFVRLFNQLTNVIFQMDPKTRKQITIETGFDEINPNQVRKQLEIETAEVVKLKTADIDPESEDGKRIRLLTRPLLTAFTRNTHIRSVQAESYLGFIGLSLDLARDPGLMEELCIQTGFGGSADCQSNLRLPAYAVPALHMVENIKQICERNNLDVNLPSIRFIFAPYTAIAINGSYMSEQQVLDNTARNINYLKKYIEKFHSSIAGQVRIDIDNPWTEHNETTQIVHKYFSNLLLQSEDQSVRSVLDKLRELGMHHGDEDGQRLACDYAAVHSLIFSDALECPKDNFFSILHKPLMTISIGGRPERFFNVARGFIRKRSSIHHLLNTSPDGILEQLEAYKDSLIESRARYGDTLDPNFIHEGDKPIASVSAITFVGASPVYYATEYDLPVAIMSDKPINLLKQMEIEIDKKKSGQEKSLAKERLKIIVHDIGVMIADVDGEDQLMDFIAGLLERGF